MMGASFPEKPLPAGTNPRRRRVILALGLVFVVVLLGYLAVADNGSPGSSPSSSSSLSVSSSVSSLTTTSSSSLPTGTQVYEVSFRQPGVCSPPVYGAPWSVTIDNETVVEPPTASPPLPNTTLFSTPSNSNYSVIAFSLPNGVYPYHIDPEYVLTPFSGTVTVDGSDVTIDVGDIYSCTTTSQSRG